MLETLFEEIQKRRSEDLKRNAGPWPRTHPVASDISPCARETALAILHWNQRPPFDDGILGRLEVGSEKEQGFYAKMARYGLAVVEQQQFFELRNKSGQLILRGKIDGKIEWQHQRVPFDYKTVNPFIFNRLNTVEDFLHRKFFNKYPKQLWAYEYGNNIDIGFLLLDNLLGEWKFIEVPMDWEAMEAVLKQCESAVGHIASGSLPDFHSDPSVCASCWARGRVCDPPAMRGEGLQVIPDPEFEAKLNRRAELDSAATEYDALDKEIKKTIKGKTNLIIGQWLIMGEQKDRKGYDVKPGKYWQSKIERISDGKKL